LDLLIRDGNHFRCNAIGLLPLDKK